MANFLSKQLRLFRLAHKITARRGVNNGTVWCKRNFHCVFHKLSHPVSPLYRTKEAKHFFPPQTCWCCWGKKSDRHCVTSSGEEVHYSSQNVTIHQKASVSGIILHRGLTSADIDHTYVNHSKATLSLSNLPLHRRC